MHTLLENITVNIVSTERARISDVLSYVGMVPETTS